MARVLSRPVPTMKMRSRGTASRAAATTTSDSVSVRRGASPLDPSATMPRRPERIQREMLERIADGSTSPSASKGVAIGGKTPDRFTRGAYRRTRCKPVSTARTVVQPWAATAVVQPLRAAAVVVQPFRAAAAVVQPFRAAESLKVRRSCDQWMLGPHGARSVRHSFARIVQSTWSRYSPLRGSDRRRRPS